jgi:hypothetical protein
MDDYRQNVCLVTNRNVAVIFAWIRRLFLISSVWLLIDLKTVAFFHFFILISFFSQSFILTIHFYNTFWSIMSSFLDFWDNFRQIEKNSWVQEFWFVLILMGSIFTLIFKRLRRMNLLQRCGIPGPAPNFFTGNMFQCFSLPNVIFDSKLINK